MSSTHISLDKFNLKKQSSDVPVTQEEAKQVCEQTVKDIKNFIEHHKEEIISANTTNDYVANNEDCYKEVDIHISLDFLQKLSADFDQITIGYTLLQSMDHQPTSSEMTWFQQVFTKPEQNKLNTKLNQKIVVKANTVVEEQHIYFEFVCKKQKTEGTQSFFTIHKVQLNPKIIDFSHLEVTEEDVLEAQQLWANGIVRMGQLKDDRKELEEFANDFLQKQYAFDLKKLVLFKPTKASEVAFRTNHESALSYFIGKNNSYKEDKGFAINPWTKVKFLNAAILCEKNGRALAMGNYWFTDLQGKKTKVDYTFGYFRDEQGNLRIDLHHSSLPFVDAEKLNCLKCTVTGQTVVADVEDMEELIEKEKEIELKAKQIAKQQQKRDIQSGTGQFKLPLYELNDFNGFYKHELSYGTNMTICIECSSKPIEIKSKYNELKYQCQDIHVNNHPFECAQDAVKH